MQSPHSLKRTVSQQFSRLFLVCKLLTMKDNFGKEFSPNNTDTNFPDHDQSNKSFFRRTFTWFSWFHFYLQNQISSLLLALGAGRLLHGTSHFPAGSFSKFWLV